MSGPLDEYFEGLEFTPDEFQVEAAQQLAAGRSVVVAAPTGAGKTVVAEAAVHLAATTGRRVFYTTPIKALSNQKYSDLVAEWGEERVGLLTGDNVINGDADIVVMTTEVLRNMIYADSSRLSRVEYVILDEVHYLQDRFRGGVWEEIIIHAPPHILMVCLSATVANGREFTDWVEERRGPTGLIEAKERPVPLESMYILADRAGERQLHMLPTFTTRDGRTRPNPRLEHMLGLERGRRIRFGTPRRIETVTRLAEENMLPAIYFIFSRSGCDTATRTLVDAGVRLTTSDDRARIRDLAEERTAHLEDKDLDTLDYDMWLVALESGVGTHHAGMIPAFKETVEELFSMGLLRVVFATETLALGINMPARTVVIENLSKFNGEAHELLKPGDYTQLTGRAGRRGIDTKGYGIVLHSPFVKLGDVTSIASVGSHPLVSSFRPNYNMVVNLVANYAEAEAEALLEASFAAFQSEGGRSDARRTLDSLYDRLEKEEERARCDRGDVNEYLALVESATTPRGVAESIVAQLRVGDVFDVSGGSRSGRYVLLKRLARKDAGARFLVMGTSGRVSTLGHREIVAGSSKAGTIDLPMPFRPRDRRFKQDTLRALRRVPSGRPPGPETAEALHPVASCPDAARHISAARSAVRTRRNIEQMRALVLSTGKGLVDEFRAVEALLDHFGYVDGWSLTGRGQLLRKLFNELDLVLAEALERGIFEDLDAAEVAAFASVFVYEPRLDQPSVPVWPNARLAERWEALEAIWEEVVELERERHLTPTRRPDPGFGELAFQWAQGVFFEDVSTSGMAPGDFVRVTRQLVDLLRQLRSASPQLANAIADAIDNVDRGVVAAQGVA